MGGNWTEISTGLKLFVITVTGLLVIGLILLAVGMARTAGKMVEKAEVRQAAVPGPVGEHRFRLPPGTRLQSVDADGGRLYLHLVDAAGGDRVVVLDAASGRHLGQIRIEPAP